MRIYTYILCWNEEKILPFTLDHYNQFSDRIFLLDNYSTDKSLEIARKYEKVTVVPYSCKEEDKYDEKDIANLRSNIYKDTTYGYNTKGKANWAIIVDADEFVYHPDIEGILEEYLKKEVGIPRLAGYDMYSKEFPEYKKGELLTQKVKLGVESMSECKPVIINPNIVDVTYSPGAHFLTQVSGRGLPSVNADIKLLHYKSLGKEHVAERYEQLGSRSSWENIANKYGEHWYDEKVRKSSLDAFDGAYEDAIQVVPDEEKRQSEGTSKKSN